MSSLESNKSDLQIKTYNSYKKKALQGYNLKSQNVRAKNKIQHKESLSSRSNNSITKQTNTKFISDYHKSGK